MSLSLHTILGINIVAPCQFPPRKNCTIVYKVCNSDLVNTKVTVISDEFKAIQFAIDNAESNTFIMYFPDEILKAVDYIKKLEQKFMLNDHFLEGKASA